MPDLLEKKLRGRCPRRSGSNRLHGEAGICGEQPCDARVIAGGNCAEQYEKLRVRRSIAGWHTQVSMLDLVEIPLGRFCG